MTVRQQTYIGSFLLVLLVGLSCVAGYYNADVAQTLTSDLVQYRIAEFAAAKDCAIGLQKTRIGEREFALDHDPEVVQQVQQGVEGIRGNLRVIAAASPNAALRDRAVAASLLASRYGAAFQQLVDAVSARGLTRDQGLQGDLIAAGDMLEGSLRDLPQLAEQLAPVRRQEQRFLATGSQESAAQFRLLARRPADAITRMGGPAERRQRLVGQLNGYMESLKELEAGNAGIRAQTLAYDAAASALEQEVAAITKAVGDQMTRSQQQVSQLLQKGTRVMLGILLAALCAGGTISIGMSRSLGRSLHAIRAGILAMAAGDLSQRVSVTTADEFGELATAFNDMAVKLQNSTDEITKTRDYIANILRSMGDCLIVVRPDGIVRNVNRRTAEALGYDEEKLVGQSTSFIFADQPTDASELPFGLRSGQDLAVNQNMVLKTSSGDRIPVSLNSAVMRDPAGVPLAFIAVARDERETHRLMREAALVQVEREKSRELELLLQQLRETQAQLVQAGKLAAVGELAGGVAHEINNPLSVILTYAVLMKERLESLPAAAQPALAEFSKRLDLVRKASERCKKISDGLLAFARATPTPDTTVNISAVVSATFELISATLRHKGIQLKVDCDSSLTVRGNPNELQQVFTNLGLNALQAMEIGGTLIVRAHRGDDGGAIISFQDTGHGIHDDIIGKIFDPFFTTKPVGQGTGLGLSIAYGIIQNHGGEIKVESVPGTGTTFRIRLPTRL